MNIGVDIDDTLSDIWKVRWLVADKYIKDNNMPYKRIDFNTNYFNLAYDWPNEISDIFWKTSADSVVKNASVRPFAREVLNALKSEGNTIFIISKRTKSWHENPYEISYEWLNKNNIPYDKLLVDLEDKTQTCVDNKIDIFIDDLPENLLPLQEFNIKTFLMTAPHNKSFNSPDIIKVNSWKDFYKKVHNI